MYKILLVDDEKLVLKSLQFSVEWELYGFEVVGSANSALEALEKIDRLSPDVVFTDIHMADISGLELLQMIRQKSPDIYCVVISGYAEFGYVKKAMELESVGYCLKPFDYDEITKYLKKIKQKLDQDRKKKDMSSILADHMMRRDASSISYMERFYQSQGIDFERQDLFAVCIMGLHCVDALTCALSVPVGYRKQICLVRQEEREPFLGSLRQLAGEEKLHVGCSHRIESVSLAPREIQEAYRCAYQFFCDGDGAWLKEAPDSWEDQTVVKAFQTELQKGEEGIQKSFDILRGNFRKGCCSVDAALMVWNIVQMMWSESNEENTFVWDYDSLLDEYQYVGAMLDSFEEQCRLLFQTGTQNVIANRTFREIYNYVEANFRQSITISDIAARFFVNNCYVSQLFKKEIGKTFTEFLTEKRIQYACGLLLHSDRNINEIAEQAGFKDYFYFSRIFRKMKQCTPTEYRAGGDL